MKRIDLIVKTLALVAALACALGASAYDFSYGVYYCNILTDSTASITYQSNTGNSYSGNVTIPEIVYNGTKSYTVVRIDFRAFALSTGLTSVTIPNTVTCIKSRAFEGCTALRTVVMGKNCSFYDTEVHGTNTRVFENCPDLTSITCWMFEPHMWAEVSGLYNFDQSVLNNATLYVPRGAIPYYQATEGWQLFANMQEISATYNYDFYYEGVFYKIKNGTAWATYMDEDYNTYSYTVTIPEKVIYNSRYYTVKGIDDYAFRECDNLTKVNMPATIDSIGKYAFTYCTKMTDIDIPNGVRYIGNGAFYYCTKLKSLMFPARMTVVNGSTCAGCHALETVWLPVNLTDIYAGAFYFCNAITRIISLNAYPPSMYSKNVFTNTVYDNATLYVPEDAAGYGYTSPYGNWQYFITQKPYNQYLSDAINVTGGNITFSTPSTDNYPWLVKTNSNRICAQSGNTGIHGSASVLTATVTGVGILSFLYKAWGEGTSRDYCRFYIDGELQFSYADLQNDWETYTVELDEGDHTLEWRYNKDGSSSKEGDYFAIDDVCFTPYVDEAYACFTESNTTLTFYYDTQRSHRTGTTYDLNTGTNDTGWDSDNTKSYVTRVVFDPSFAGARPTTTYDWFYNMVNLRSITGLGYLNTSEVTNMRYMFFNCNKLTILDLSGFNTSKVTDMGRMFYGCSSLTILDLSSFYTYRVTDMGYMFYDSSNLLTVYVGNGWSTAAVTYSTSMFYGCTRLVGGQGTAYDYSNPKDKTYAHIDGGPSNPGYFTDANGPRPYACYTPSNTTLTFYYDTQRGSRPGTTYDLNLGTNDTDWDTDGTKSNVTKVVFDPSFASARPTTTYDWFYKMVNLLSFTGMSYLNTSEVSDMGFMFYGCNQLTSIDVSHFNTSRVTSMAGLFGYCSSLTSLDVSSLNTSSVTDMYVMFSGCSSLTSLDLSSFNTSQVTDMGSMFYGDRNLRTIYVGSGWSTAAVTYSSNMFYGCTSLVGGQGTAYDGGHLNKDYAHIDGGTSNPGYFTDKNAILLGDVNGDGSVDVADVTALISAVLNGTTVSINAADMTGDGEVDVADVTALIGFVLGN